MNVFNRFRAFVNSKNLIAASAENKKLRSKLTEY